MSPATVWTELQVTGAGFQEGFVDPSYDSSTDYFIDPLFEGTAFFALMPTPYVELAVAATAGTELSLGVSTPYVELTL